MAVVVTTGAIRHTKLQSDCHHQQTNTQFFTGTHFLQAGCPVNIVRALKHKVSHCMDLITLSSLGEFVVILFQNCYKHMLGPRFLCLP